MLLLILFANNNNNNKVGNGGNIRHCTMCEHAPKLVETNLTFFQLDATYSVYYITVGSSTCFGC